MNSSVDPHFNFLKPRVSFEEEEAKISLEDRIDLQFQMRVSEKEDQLERINGDIHTLEIVKSKLQSKVSSQRDYNTELENERIKLIGGVNSLIPLATQEKTELERRKSTLKQKRNTVDKLFQAIEEQQKLNESLEKQKQLLIQSGNQRSLLERKLESLAKECLEQCQLIEKLNQTKGARSELEESIAQFQGGGVNNQNGSKESLEIKIFELEQTKKELLRSAAVRESQVEQVDEFGSELELLRAEHEQILEENETLSNRIEQLRKRLTPIEKEAQRLSSQAAPEKRWIPPRTKFAPVDKEEYFAATLRALREYDKTII